MPSNETIMSVAITRVHDRYARVVRGPSFLAQKLEELFDLASKWRAAMLDERGSRRANYIKCRALEAALQGLCAHWEDVDVHAVLDWGPEDPGPQVDLFFHDENHGITEINLFGL